MAIGHYTAAQSAYEAGPALIKPLLKSVKARKRKQKGVICKSCPKCVAYERPFTASLLPGFQMLKHISETTYRHYKDSNSLNSYNAYFYITINREHYIKKGNWHRFALYP